MHAHASLACPSWRQTRSSRETHVCMEYLAHPLLPFGCHGGWDILVSWVRGRIRTVPPSRCQDKASKDSLATHRTPADKLKHLGSSSGDMDQNHDSDKHFLSVYSVQHVGVDLASREILWFYKPIQEQYASMIYSSIYS